MTKQALIERTAQTLLDGENASFPEEVWHEAGKAFWALLDQYEPGERKEILAGVRDHLDDVIGGVLEPENNDRYLNIVRCFCVGISEVSPDDEDVRDRMKMIGETLSYSRDYSTYRQRDQARAEKALSALRAKETFSSKAGRIAKDLLGTEALPELRRDEAMRVIGRALYAELVGLDEQGKKKLVAEIRDIVNVAVGGVMEEHEKTERFTALSKGLFRGFGDAQLAKHSSFDEATKFTAPLLKIFTYHDDMDGYNASLGRGAANPAM